MGRAGRRRIQWIVTVLFAAAASSASAEPEKCQRTIAKASAKFAKDKSKALRKCEDKKVSGDLPASTVCLSDPKTAGSIEKAETKLAGSINKDCGGRDKTCGTADDDSLASIGWGSVTTCPNFENGSCDGPITDCGDIATCIACVDEAAVDQAIDLYYGDLASGEFGSNSATNKCQRAIGKETTKFLQSKSKALQKCWDARIKEKHSAACPTPGDGKAAAAIQKAEEKKVKNICKACGGADKACGGGDDLTPGQVGFASSCPDVTVPEGGSSCGGAILDMQAVVECVDCVTEFKVDCMDRLTVPQFVPYPPECNEVPATSTSTTSTTSTSSSTVTSSSSTTTQPGLCGNGEVDPGEECDPGSPGSVFLCDSGEVCSAACVCEATTTTTSSTTTTTQPGLCGNGEVDPGEECDPGSPGSAFLCDAGEVCSPACVCESTSTTTVPSTTTTTSTNTTTSTTSSSSTTTPTTQPGLCGNGEVDPGEECDPGSPGSAFLCEPGEVCSPACVCESTTTTTTSSSSTTTQPGLCGNGEVDPGEECDPGSPGSAFLCGPGEFCSVACTCVAASSTTTSSAPPTTAAPTTSSTTSQPPTTASTSTSTSSSTSTSTTTLVYGSPSQAFVRRHGSLLE